MTDLYNGRVNREMETAGITINYEDETGGAPRVDFEITTGCAIISFSLSVTGLESLAEEAGAVLASIKGANPS